MGDSLLAHIVKKYASTQWENIATDSLHYLLSRPGAEEALLRLLPSTGWTTGPLIWRTQLANEDQSRPDLVGLDTEGRPKLVLEVKFWAALTGNQPNAYLATQDTAYPGEPSQRLLVFLVPRNRLNIIRRELWRRVEQELDDTKRQSPGLDDVQVLLAHRISVLTWAQVLSELRATLAANGDEAGLRDLAQLEGLCDRADAEAMLPITDEDIDPGRAQRHLDFVSLVERTADLLIAQKAASANRLRWSNGTWGSGRYLRAPGGVIFWFGTYPEYWATRYPTPWWLLFGNEHPAEVHQALKSFTTGPRFPYVVGPPVYYRTIVAVPPPLGMEADEAAKSMADFIAEVCESLPVLATPQTAPVSETSLAEESAGS